MSWYKKEQATPFDILPVEGLHFLHGDVMAIAFQRTFLKGQKYPLIQFPSGEQFSIWESSQPESVTVHLFGEMDLSYKQTRDEAFETAIKIADILGYIVRRIEDNQLRVQGFSDDDHYLITYDNEKGCMTDIQPITSSKEKPKHPAHILVNDEIKSQLPPLYTNEEIGMKAVAPVKYFHPTSDWAWYPTEYDPQKGIFFGLVVGYEIELGYFSLEELETIGDSGGLTLSVERDLNFKPMTLEEIKFHHQKLRDDE